MQEYDRQHILQLFKDFYRLAQVKICLYDTAGNEILNYPEKLSPFCRQLRENPEKESLCLACDRRSLAECKRTHKTYSHICHAGLYECFSPIVLNNQVIGYIAIGQVRSAEYADSSTPPKFLLIYQHFFKVYRFCRLRRSAPSFTFWRSAQAMII